MAHLSRTPVEITIGLGGIALLFTIFRTSRSLDTKISSLETNLTSRIAKIDDSLTAVQQQLTSRTETLSDGVAASHVKVAEEAVAVERRVGDKLDSRHLQLSGQIQAMTERVGKLVDRPTAPT